MLDRLLSDIEPGDYVPGFRLPKLKLQHGNYGAVILHKGKGGRPIEWTRTQLDKLVNDVDHAKQKHGLTDDEALRYVKRHGKWACSCKRLKNILADERKAQRGADLLYQDYIRARNPEN
jgi:hypothetical protein